MLEGKALLVLEDEPIIGFMLEDILQSLGASRVEVTTRVAEALAMLALPAVDLAVLDVNVHGQLSYPVADRLAEAGIPFVFATGYGDREHPERHRGVVTLGKPFSALDVSRALASLLA